MKPIIDYQVRDEEIETHLRDIGALLGKSLEGSGYGFMLMMFTMGPGGNLFYISNAERESIIRTLDEFKEKFREN